MPLTFAQSPRSTVGIEWELALVDRESGELRNVADQVLSALYTADFSAHPRIVGELLLNTVELITTVHETVPSAVNDLAALLSELRTATDTLGIELVGAGSHPLAHWTDQEVANKERYRKLIESTQWWGRNMMIWGVHVHVGIEDRAKVIPILHALLAKSPQLQAIAASSPFWAGEATGYASNRALMFQQLPTAGLPYDLPNWDAFDQFTADLQRTHVIEDVSEIRWDVRPAPRWGTIEFRACDGLSTLEEVGAVAAYVQSLTEYFSGQLDRGERTPHLKPWFARENKWRAARYGLDAVIIVNNDGDEAPVRDQITNDLALLAPTAARLGCADELEFVGQILERGAGYQRQLEVFERSNDLHDVTQFLAREQRHGLS